MSQFVHIAAFWVVLVIAIRLAVCFPQSLLARVLFYQHGPAAIRGETKAEYLLRCAAFRASWFLQAAFLFVVGWIALRWDATLADSLYFLVLWAAVIPLLGASALLGALFALGRSLWSRRFGCSRATSGSSHGAQV
jgi:hypothetical protein